jgi:hypothetical protein
MRIRKKDITGSFNRPPCTSQECAVKTGWRGLERLVAPLLKQIRAAYIEQLEPAEFIRYRKLPIPAPGPTDVLVPLEGVAVNPVDTFVRSGAYPTLLRPLPANPACSKASTTRSRSSSGWPMGSAMTSTYSSKSAQRFPELGEEPQK